MAFQPMRPHEDMSGVYAFLAGEIGKKVQYDAMEKARVIDEKYRADAMAFQEKRAVIEDQRWQKRTDIEDARWNEGEEARKLTMEAGRLQLDQTKKQVVLAEQDRVITDVLTSVYGKASEGVFRNAAGVPIPDINGDRWKLADTEASMLLKEQGITMSPRVAALMTQLREPYKQVNMLKEKTAVAGWVAAGGFESPEKFYKAWSEQSGMSQQALGQWYLSGRTPDEIGASVPQFPMGKPQGGFMDQIQSDLGVGIGTATAGFGLGGGLGAAVTLPITAAEAGLSMLGEKLFDNENSIAGPVMGGAALYTNKLLNKGVTTRLTEAQVGKGLGEIGKAERGAVFKAMRNGVETLAKNPEMKKILGQNGAKALEKALMNKSAFVKFAMKRAPGTMMKFGGKMLVGTPLAASGVGSVAGLALDAWAIYDIASLIKDFALTDGE